MRIKKLELNGFKSFKDRTVIHFDPGTTGIVGPNGCGKSNIVDALVWVMGEMSAKHLRGSNMADVIFAGAEGYAPMGMAEVSLTLENDGGAFPVKYSKNSEIQITRRLHRSGESEYIINKEQARLRDIQEIFMDTGAGSKGFSIIEQGAIGKIITAKPEDRRSLIEEAAGISKFKVRKKESQRKLVSTEQNLVRLQDIIGEQRRQIGSLERQAQKAERYRKIKSDYEEKDLWLSSFQYSDLRVSLHEADSSFNELQSNEVDGATELEKMESDLESLKLQVAEAENTVNDLQVRSKVQNDLVRQKENEIRELEFEIEQAKRDKEKTGSIMDQYRARKLALDTELSEVNLKLLNLREEAADAVRNFEEKNEQYSQLQEKINNVDRALSETRREQIASDQAAAHLEAKHQSGLEKKSEMAVELEELKLGLLDLKSKYEEFLKNRNSINSEFQQHIQLQLEIMSDVENFEENHSHLSNHYEEKLKENNLYKENHAEVSAKLYGLEDLHSSFEGFQEGVKNVMLWQRKKQEEMHLDGSAQAEFLPLSEVVEVPEEFEMAMEAGLGHRLQMLLAENHNESLSAVDYLKENNSGRSSFFSLGESVSDEVEAGVQLTQEEGVKSLLSDVAKIPEKFNKQITYILKDVVVVDSIRTALRLRPLYSGKTFVTTEGDTLSPEGVLTGGTTESAGSGVLKRKREIKELSEKREEWAGKLSLSQLALEKISKQLKSLAKDLENAKQKKYDKELLVAGLKKDIERAENELSNAERAVQQQNNIVDQKDQKFVLQEQHLSETEESLNDLRERCISGQAKVVELEQELSDAKTGFDGLQDEVRDLQVNSVSKQKELEGIEEQKKRLDSSLVEINSSLSEMDEETQKSVDSLSSNSLLVEEKRLEFENCMFESEKMENQLSDSKNDYEIKLAKMREVENQVHTTHKSLNEYKSQLNDAHLKLEQLKLKETYLLEHIQEKYQKNLTEIFLQYKDVPGEVSEVERELEALKEKINRMGEVNLSAIDEYDHLKERFEFLSQQHSDLIEAKKQLTKVIDRINKICSVRFKETFDLVNDRFQKVFPVLFGGGEARLILIEPDEDAVGKKAEMGIDIIARPPGKKLQSVNLLSGGEKALTAVSLIFSIFLVKPSPYCLLDEVDAPLDDANVMRFNDLVKEMAKRSQIIIVTHNKHTMKVNKKLYGVTMEEKGVSKMVSVDLDVAEKVVNL